MNGYHAPIQFKHHHKKRRYGKAKLRINLTVIFITVFIIACIVGTVLLGNHLKKKLEAEQSGGTGDTFASDQTTANGDFPSVSDAALAANAKRAGCCIIGGGSAAKVFDSGYDSAVIPLTDEDGVLLYDSAAAQALSRQSADNGLPDLADFIDEIRQAASARGIDATVTVYYDMTFAEASEPVISEATLLYETAVIAEAYSKGADEALLTGLPVFNNTISDPDAILSVIGRLHESVPDMKITVALPYEIFANRGNSQALDDIADAAGALAVDATPLDWSYSETVDEYPHTDDMGGEVTDKQIIRHTSVFEQIDRASSEIKSSIQLYSLGFVIYGDVLFNVKEAVDALVKNGTYSYYVITAPDGETILPPTVTDPESGSDDGQSTDAPTERPTERPTEQQTEPQTEPTTTVPEPETVPPTEPVTGSETEESTSSAETDATAEPETDPVAEPTTEPVTEPQTEHETEPPTTPETDAPAEPETDAPTASENTPDPAAGGE